MSGPAPNLVGVHVLLVDDNEDARAILGTYLEHLGATVTYARNAGDALAAMNELRAHVIVSDLSMPGMDGLELLTRIRSLPAEQDSPTPAIAFSGFVDQDGPAQLAGYAKFIRKPADPLEIAVEIAMLLHRVEP